MTIAVWAQVGLRLVSGALLFWVALSAQADYRAHPEAQILIDAMVEEKGFSRESLLALFAQAERQESILEAIARPAEKTKTWREYRPIFVVPLRISRGVEFWH